MTSSHRDEHRQHLYRLLGELPDRHRKINVDVVSIEQRETYQLEKLMLDLNGEEPVPAYFVRPHKQTNPMPTILYNHAHGGDFILG